MQKKLIALAVAGLVSAPAFAQSNVQIYGIMDLGFRTLSGAENTGPAGTANLKRYSGIDNDGQASSRIGFRGTEDLGNGMKAFFQIEQGLDADRNAAGGNRQIFVGMEGNFGRVWLGRDFNPSRAMVTGLDPFGSTGIGNNQQIFQQQTRLDNAIFYRTPNFSGLTVTAAYTTNTNGNGNEDIGIISGAQDTRVTGWVINPVYKNGPLTAGFGYESYDRENAARQSTDRTRWNLGGGYDFGVVKASLVYGQTKDKNPTAGQSDQKRKSWMLGLTAPVSEAGKVLFSYNRTKFDDGTVGPDEKASQWALGYSHSLSKRTSVYATYAKISTNNEAEGSYSLGQGNPGEWTTGSDGFDRSYTSGFNVGIRHNF